MDPERAHELVDALAFAPDQRPDVSDALRALAMFLLQLAQRLSDLEIELHRSHGR